MPPDFVVPIENNGGVKKVINVATVILFRRIEIFLKFVFLSGYYIEEIDDFQAWQNSYFDY